MRVLTFAMLAAIMAGGSAVPAASGALQQKIDAGDHVLNLTAGDALTGGAVIAEDTVIHGAIDKSTGAATTLALADGESIVVLPGAKLTLDHVALNIAGAKGVGINVGEGATGDFDNMTITGGFYAIHFSIGSTGHLTNMVATGQQEAFAHEGNGSLSIKDSTITQSVRSAVHVAYNPLSTHMDTTLINVDISDGGNGLFAEGITTADVEDCYFHLLDQGIAGQITLDAKTTLFVDNRDNHINLVRGGDGFRPTATVHDSQFAGGENGIVVDDGYGHIQSCTFDDMTNGVAAINGAGSQANHFALQDVTMTTIASYGVAAEHGGYLDVVTSNLHDCQYPVVLKGGTQAAFSRTDIGVTYLPAPSPAITLRGGAGGVFDHMSIVSHLIGFDASEGAVFTVSNSMLEGMSSGLVAYGGCAVTVTDNQITGSSWDAVVIGSDDKSDTTTCDIEDNFIHDGMTGIRLTNGGPQIIRGNEIYGCQYGVEADGLVSGSVIEQNAIHQNTTLGMQIYNPTDVLVQDNLIYDHLDGTGVLADGTGRITFERNCFFNNEYGIQSEGPDATMSENSFDLNATGSRAVPLGGDPLASIQFARNAFLEDGTGIDVYGAAADIQFNSFAASETNYTGVFTSRNSCPAPVDQQAAAPNNYWNSPNGARDFCVSADGDGLRNFNTISTPFLTGPNMDAFYATSFYGNLSGTRVFTREGAAAPWLTGSIGGERQDAGAIFLMRPPDAPQDPPPGVVDPMPVYLWITKSLSGDVLRAVNLAFAMPGDPTNVRFAHYNRDTNTFDASLDVTTDPDQPGRWIVNTTGNKLPMGTWYFHTENTTQFVDAAMLGPTSDLWIAQGLDDNTFAAPVRTATFGVHFDMSASVQAIAGDFNGDGLDDIATITHPGQLIGAFNVPPDHFTALRQDFQSVGWRYDPAIGWRAFPGDFNGDGRTDLLQMTEFTDNVWVGLSDGETIPNPSPAGLTGFKYRPTEGWWIGVADMNGDGRDDLIQCTPYEDAWVSLAADGGRFNDGGAKWAHTGFQWDFSTHYGIVAGDFDGDGKADLLQVTPYGDAWVAISTGHSLNDPTKWAYLNFKDAYDSYDGQNPACFAVDINRDGKADLVQLTDLGELWGAISTGSSFNDPIKLGEVGYRHSDHIGRYQTFFGNFTNDRPLAKSAAAESAAENAHSTSTSAAGAPRAKIPPTPTPSLTPTPQP